MTNEIKVREAYERHWFDSSKLTILIDCNMDAKVENALVEFVERKLEETQAFESLQVIAYHGNLEESDISNRLKETSICAGISFEIQFINEEALYDKFCGSRCFGKNLNFYKISSDGYVAICVNAKSGEYAVAHLLKELDEDDISVAKNRIRKEALYAEDYEYFACQ